VAENEQLKYGVPASVILASGLLMSEAGNAELSREGNNFFALPCTADWKGQEGYHDGKCFRYYENAWTSFRDNSLYLTTYLFPGKQLPADDYKSWVAALEQVKYGDEPNLAAQLAKIIDHYDLHELD
jgi:flagellum-specific peptidoglycan hydrolase FlgJ